MEPGSGPRCPCCGAPMLVDSETPQRVTLKCPGCLTTDLRLK